MSASGPKKVVGIRGAMPAHGVPCADVVNFLNDLLNSAKRGAVTGIAVCWIGPAQSVNTGWAPGMADRHDMVAAASMLQFKIIQACING